MSIQKTECITSLIKQRACNYTHIGRIELHTQQQCDEHEVAQHWQHDKRAGDERHERNVVVLVLEGAFDAEALDDEKPVDDKVDKS